MVRASHILLAILALGAATAWAQDIAAAVVPETAAAAAVPEQAGVEAARVVTSGPRTVPTTTPNPPPGTDPIPGCTRYAAPRTGVTGARCVLCGNGLINEGPFFLRNGDCLCNTNHANKIKRGRPGTAGGPEGPYAADNTCLRCPRFYKTAGVLSRATAVCVPVPAANVGRRMQ